MLLRTRATSFFRNHGVEVALVVTLAVLALFVRFVQLEPIENGGDPLDNWYFVRQWAYDNDPARARLDHHASRFGIHWITWIVQSVFGTHPRVYYLPPLFASVVATLLTYALGRLVSGRFVGLVAGVLLLECAPFVTASSQLRPGIFQTMYALAAAVCLVRFVDRQGRAALVWVSASALFIFLAYLSHEPSAFLAPGAMLVVWLKRRNLGDLLVFSAVLGGLVVAETAAYATFTQYWSRVDVLRGSHLTQPAPPRAFGYLFERFTRAGAAIKLAYYPFFVAGPLLLLLRRPLRERVPVLLAGSFLFFATFFVRSVNPIVLFIGVADRYILIAVPLAYVATLHCIVVVTRAALVRFGIGARFSRAPSWVSRALGSAGIVALMAAVAWRADSRARRPHPFRTIDAIYDTLNDTYGRNLPIIGRVTARKPTRRGTLVQVRALHWAHKGFLKDEFFVEDGRLSDFKYADLATLSKNERYFPDVPELDPERVQALDKRGCALHLENRGYFVAMSRQKRFPSRCVP
jgi:hypothetical protein